GRNPFIAPSAPLYRNVTVESLSRCQLAEAGRRVCKIAEALEPGTMLGRFCARRQTPRIALQAPEPSDKPSARARQVGQATHWIPTSLHYARQADRVRKIARGVLPGCRRLAGDFAHPTSFDELPPKQ